MSQQTHSNDACIFDYQIHLKQALGRHDKTIDAALRHIREFERRTKNKPFQQITRDDIIEFKRQIVEADGRDKTLSASTIVHCFGCMKAFFQWLVKQPGYKTMRLDLYEYFTAEKRLSSIANAPKLKQVPTREELVTMITSMPSSTFWQRRDRAILALMCLCGIRDGALVTLQLKHVDNSTKTVFQDAGTVSTKNSKTMRTTWFPMGEVFELIFTAWVDEMTALGLPDTAPLFPRVFQQNFGADDKGKLEFFNSSDHVRKVVREAAKAAEVKKFTPHAIRATIARLIPEWGITPAERKAMSQNLGHEQYATTDIYYGSVDPETQHELILGLRDRKNMDEMQEFFVKFARAPRHIQEGMMRMVEM
jgi:integrase